MFFIEKCVKNGFLIIECFKEGRNIAYENVLNISIEIKLHFAHSKLYELDISFSDVKKRRTSNYFC